MKKYFCYFALLFFVLSSCGTLHTGHHGSLPPGQAKKVDGAQSARDYAPGQQKKVKNKPEGSTHSMKPDKAAP